MSMQPDQQRKRDRFKLVVFGSKTHSGATAATTPQSSSLSLPTTPRSTISANTNLVPNSAPVCTFWADALMALQPGERAIIQKYCSTPPKDAADLNKTLDGIVCIVKDQRSQSEAKQWTYTCKGKQVPVRNSAEHVIDWLNRFKRVGDIAANANPIYAGLPWAGISLLLEAATSEKQLLASLLSGLDRTLNIVRRCDVYNDLYLKSSSQSRALSNFQDSLTMLYKKTFRFLAIALQNYERNTASRAWHAFWNPDEISSFENEFKQAEGDVETAATNLDRTIRTQNLIQDEARSQTLADELKQLRDLRIPLADVSSMVKDIRLRLTDGEISEILYWTSNMPYKDHHSTAKLGRVENTGEWIFNHTIYEDWSMREETAILWVNGNPGAGKTKLVSRIVDSYSNRPETEGLAYFYCNRNESSRRAPESIFRCLVKQLAQPRERDGHKLHQGLSDIYQKKKQTGFASAALTMQEAVDLIQDMTKGYAKTLLTIDALDECEEDSRAEVISAVDKLQDRSLGLKILISSRRNEDIKVQLQKAGNLGISATDNENDIKKFVQQKIHEDEQRRTKQGIRLVPEPLKEKIAMTLLEQSQGMFQWAVLQIGQLLSLNRDKDIEARLGKLPKDLREVYDEIFKEIEAYDDSRCEVAIRAFQWLTGVSKPLKVDVMVAAVCQDPDLDDVQLVDIDRSFLLSACRNLLVIDTNNLCRFSHLSVREYFQSRKEYGQQVSKETIATVCFKLLIRSTFTAKDHVRHPMFRTRAGSGLLEYAGDNLHFHAQEVKASDLDSRALSVLQEFLGSPTKISSSYLSWRNWAIAGGLVDRWELTGDPAGFNNPAIAELCYLGLDPILLRWLRSTRSSIAQKSAGSPFLLGLAAKGGHLSTVQILLAAGANINATYMTDGEKHTALSTASLYGHKEVVKLLLQRGADVTQQWETFPGSALQAAASSRDIEIIALLLDEGADANADYDDESPLEIASRHGHVSALQLLISKGADVNMQVKGSYGSALAAAATRNDSLAVRFLLDHGADPNMKLENGEYGTPLVAAIANAASVEVVEMLLKAGADVNESIEGRPHLSAMGASLLKKYPYMDKDNTIEHIKLLLERGADVNLCATREYCSVLATLCALKPNAGFDISMVLDSVSILLERGAEVNVPLETRFGSVLATAVYHMSDKFFSVIQLLIKYGATIEAELMHGDFGSALVAALCSPKNNDLIITLLLDGGVDFHAQIAQGHYGNTMIAASFGGKDKILKRLLGNGINVNAQSTHGHYGTPLIAAASAGQEKTVQLLIGHGADVNLSAENGRYLNALTAALQGHHVGVMEVLVGLNTDLKPLRESSNRAAMDYALIEAAAQGNGRMVDFLIRNGADINFESSSTDFPNALMAAARKNRAAIITTLINHGANVNAVAALDPEVCPFVTALQVACYYGHIEFCKILIEEGADVNLHVPLHYATDFGLGDIAHLLVDTGANVNTVRTEGTVQRQSMIVSRRWGFSRIRSDIYEGFDKAIELGYSYSYSVLDLVETIGGNNDLTYFLLQHGAKRYWEMDEKERTLAPKEHILVNI